MARKALAISRSFPARDDLAHGVYQRLDMQMAALARVASEIHCLFLLPVQDAYSADETEQHRVRLEKRWGARISLTLANTAVDAPPDSRWEMYARGIYDFGGLSATRALDNEATRAAVQSALSRSPDLVLAHRLQAMSALMRLPRPAQRPPVFFDLDDIEHVSLRRRLLHNPSWPGERLMLLHLPNLLLNERRAIRMSAGTFVCSEHDRHYLEGRLGARPVHVVPNSVSVEPRDAQRLTEPLVLFVGSMGYRPNALAADALVQEVWPSVQARVPEARLVIVGNRPELTSSYPSSNPSVHFAGFVDNLDEIYSRTRVVCCPIYQGAGTRVKIIEAAAQACAVVSTPLGAEGLDFEDGREILLREQPAALADACVRLLQNPGEAATLAGAAWKKAHALYDRRAIIDHLARIFANGATS